jgi:uncharacterized OsmC-like protein
VSRTIRGEGLREAHPLWGPLPEAGAELVGTRVSGDGEYVLSAREARVRSDARNRGGPEIYAGELLLGALASCALASVEGAAADAGVPLRDVRVVVRSERGDTAPPKYSWFSIDFALDGIGQPEAEALVEVFLETCPIYGTLAAVSPIAVRVSAGR